MAIPGWSKRIRAVSTTKGWRRPAVLSNDEHQSTRRRLFRTSPRFWRRRSQTRGGKSARGLQACPALPAFLTTSISSAISRATFPSSIELRKITSFARGTTECRGIVSSRKKWDSARNRIPHKNRRLKRRSKTRDFVGHPFVFHEAKSPGVEPKSPRVMARVSNQVEQISRTKGGDES